MSDFIEDFYYGNINPQDRSVKDGSDLQKQMALLTQKEELLAERLPEEAENENLKRMFADGMGITEIALTLQRTEPAVGQQIERLDLYDRENSPAKT